MVVVINFTEKENKALRDLCKLYNKINKTRLPYQKIIKKLIKCGYTTFGLLLLLRCKKND